VAVWRKKCGGARIWINEVDHPPPHCHVLMGSRHFKVELWTLQVLKPHGAMLNPVMRACLKEHQEEMLRAWDRVRLLPGVEP
jgi:Domain of unknown function (DUF4160)